MFVRLCEAESRRFNTHSGTCAQWASVYAWQTRFALKHHKCEAYNPILVLQLVEKRYEIEWDKGYTRRSTHVVTVVAVVNESRLYLYLLSMKFRFH